jgi:molybdopterin molybdotransferase
MPEFLQLTPPDQALNRLMEIISTRPAVEQVALLDALDRVIAEPVVSASALPPFPRSTVDGYAVRAGDTHGASESLPAYLKLTGEVPMGAQPLLELESGCAILIHTGGMLPANADAVVMLEHTQQIAGLVEILRPVAAGENLIQAGEDVHPGEIVIPAGRRLRPQEIGGLAALGITSVPVAVKPRVGILSSGDEIVPAMVEPGPGQVRDVNSFTLSALVQQAGGEVVLYGIFPDQLQFLMEGAQQALQECDIVVFTAGSSASARDLTSRVISQLGEPGILVHGVGVRPGKPTILAVCQGKVVIGLPGNPVSALVIARIFLKPVIERSLGLTSTGARAGIYARLAANLPSQAGREDWVPVRLLSTPDGLKAEPIFSKSNLIFSLVRGDGLVRVPPDATGLAANELVWVVPLD